MAWRSKARRGAWDWRGQKAGYRQPCGPMIKRWIGASHRRASRTRQAQPVETAEIIYLPWAQTFGKPSLRLPVGDNDIGCFPDSTIILTSRR